MGPATHIYDWLLPLDACHELLLLDIDYEVPALVLAVDRDGHVDVADRLRPLVWQGRLLGSLFCSRGRLLGGGWF